MTTRLLFVVNIPRFFLSHRLPLALAARDAGYDVHVATADDDPVNLERIRDTGLPVHPIPLVQHGRRPIDELRTFIALVRLYRRLRPDILHHVTIKPLIYGGIAARLTGRRSVVAAMSGLGRTFLDAAGRPVRPGLALRLALRSALPRPTTQLLFQNSEDLEMFRDLGLVDTAQATLIRGSGVDLRRFRDVPEPPASADGPVVLYAGRLMRQKGLHTLAEVARRLSGVARFHIAGYAETGSPDAVPVEQVEDWAKEGHVVWLGSRDDMPELMASANIVVLPSFREGVPKVLIEAAASGRPIVTSDVPGCREVCQDGINGLLTAPGDPDALERAIRRLIVDADLRRRMGAAGRRIAEEEFALDRVIEETLRLYERMLPSTRT